jgi:hypothetical protein
MGIKTQKKKQKTKNKKKGGAKYAGVARPPP